MENENSKTPPRARVTNAEETEQERGIDKRGASRACGQKSVRSHLRVRRAKVPLLIH